MTKITAISNSQFNQQDGMKKTEIIKKKKVNKKHTENCILVGETIEKPNKYSNKINLPTDNNKEYKHTNKRINQGQLEVLNRLGYRSLQFIKRKI